MNKKFLLFGLGQSEGHWSTTSNCLQQHGFVCKTKTGRSVTPLSTLPRKFYYLGLHARSELVLVLLR